MFFLFSIYLGKEKRERTFRDIFYRLRVLGGRKVRVMLHRRQRTFRRGIGYNSTLSELRRHESVESLTPLRRVRMSPTFGVTKRTRDPPLLHQFPHSTVTGGRPDSVGTGVSVRWWSKSCRAVWRLSGVKGSPNTSRETP